MKRTLLYIIISLSFCKAWAGWNGTSDFITHGSGTQDDPYLIETSEQLAYVADMVNSGANNFEGQFLRLTTDLSLSNRQWTPIGDKNHPFMGNFYGNGHLIDSLYSVHEWSSLIGAPLNYLGLFGYIVDAFITDIQLNVTLGQVWSGTGYAQTSAQSGIMGGIVALASNSTIRSCRVYGTIESGLPITLYSSNNWIKRFGIGGIVGIARNSILMFDENNASVKGSYVVGGVAGRLDSTVVFECTNNGNIIGSTRNLFHYNTIIVGGIAATGTKMTSIKKCKNTGNIYAENSLYSTGGNIDHGCDISGICRDVSEITFCYNTGALSANYYGSGSHNNNLVYIFGIGTNAIFKNCYNVGTVGSGEFSNRYGAVKANNVENCYYLETCFNGPEPNPQYGTQGGSPRSETQMKSAVFPQMLNIGEVVYRQDTYNENGGYPVFIDENSGVFHISVTSEDESKGSVRVLSEPTADNPEAIVVAIPRGSYHFSHWSDGSTNNPYTLTLSQDTTLIAYFANENEAIFSIEGIDAKIYSNWGQVVVDGLNGNKVSLFDESGRLLVSQGDGLHTFCYDVPFSGIYFIRVGNAPARKLVVIK